MFTHTDDAPQVGHHLGGGKSRRPGVGCQHNLIDAQLTGEGYEGMQINWGQGASLVISGEPDAVVLPELFPDEPPDGAHPPFPQAGDLVELGVLVGQQHLDTGVVGPLPVLRPAVEAMRSALGELLARSAGMACALILRRSIR